MGVQMKIDEILWPDAQPPKLSIQPEVEEKKEDALEKLQREHDAVCKLLEATVRERDRALESEHKLCKQVERLLALAHHQEVKIRDRDLVLSIIRDHYQISVEDLIKIHNSL